VVDDGLYAGRKGRLGQMSGGFCRRIKKKLFIADLVGPVNYFLGNFLCRGLFLFALMMRKRTQSIGEAEEKPQEGADPSGFSEAPRRGRPSGEADTGPASQLNDVPFHLDPQMRRKRSGDRDRGCGMGEIGHSISISFFSFGGQCGLAHIRFDHGATSG
jgi:hypothetical protein